MATFLRYLLAGVLTLAVAIALVAFAGVLAFGLGDGTRCDHRVVASVPSPDGRWQAVTYVSNCGATDPFVTQVDVLAGDRGLGRLGRSEVFRVVAGGPGGRDWPPDDEPVAAWTGLAALRVTYDSRLRVLVHEPRAARGDVVVQYSATATP